MCIFVPKTPVRLFALFITTQIVDLIIIETNCYAEQVIWCNTFGVSSEEVWAYTGFCILMSIFRLPTLRIIGGETSISISKQVIKKLFHADCKVSVSRVFKLWFIHHKNNDEVPKLLAKYHLTYRNYCKLLICNKCDHFVLGTGFTSHLLQKQEIHIQPLDKSQILAKCFTSKSKYLSRVKPLFHRCIFYLSWMATRAAYVTIMAKSEGTIAKDR